MNHKLMIATMLDMGLNREVAQALSEFAGEKPDLTADGWRYLYGPVVIHGSPWMHDVPKWLTDAIPGERYRILYGMMPGYIVGPHELTAVMMPAAMEAPMHHECAEMYFWAANKSVSAHYGPDSEAAQNAASITNAKDTDFLQSGGQYHWIYSELAHDIRRRVIRHSTWHVPKNGKAVSVPVPTASPKILVEQLDIF